MLADPTFQPTGVRRFWMLTVNGSFTVSAEYFFPGISSFWAGI